MSKTFNIIFFIINIKQILSLKENNTNIVTLKFRTYYPYVENNLSKSEIYYKKIHLSKLYLELQTGNETSYKKGKNQILNTIIDLKEVVLITTDLYFENKNKEKNNKLLCTYNTSVSDTFISSEGYYEFKDIKSLCSYSHENFKIYTDLYLEKYNITQLNVLCTINHNISKLCGNIGLAYLHTESKAHNLLGQLQKHFSLPDFTFLFNYTNKDEGIFTFGNKPHVYLPDKYNESDLFSFYTKYIYEFNLDNVLFYINDNLTDANIYIKISPDIDGFEFPGKYFNLLERKFFDKYYLQKICKNESYRGNSIIYCDESFTNEMIKSLPEIKFKISNMTFNFKGEDLFYKYENNYYFRIIERSIENHFDLGRIFLKKYIIPINPESRQIFFYQNKENKENIDNKKSVRLEYKYIIIIIVLAVLFMIIFPVGIYLGKKLSKKRNKKAYELTDGYDYTPSKEGSEPLYKE